MGGSLARRSIALCTALAAVLVLGGVPSLASRAVARSAASAHIVDPRGDAYYEVFGIDASPVVEPPPEADVIKAWFTSSARTFSIHIQTVAPPPGPRTLRYEVLTDCIEMVGLVPDEGEGLTGDPQGYFYNFCEDGGIGYATTRVRMLSDGTGLVSISVPRSTSKSLQAGKSIVAPYIRVREARYVRFGWSPAYAEIERTKRGRDFMLPPTVRSVAPGEPCPSFSPSVPQSSAENRTDALKAPTMEVTDSATARRPLVFKHRHAAQLSYMGANVNFRARFLNVQVQTQRKEVGLHARLEWEAPNADAFDMYIFDEYGTEAAQSVAMNSIPEDETGFGDGHGGWGYEYIHGLGAANCEGFTIESDPLWTTGRDMRLKVWLGKVWTREDGG
jgi:hypothetical protein